MDNKIDKWAVGDNPEIGYFVISVNLEFYHLIIRSNYADNGVAYRLVQFHHSVGNASNDVVTLCIEKGEQGRVLDCEKNRTTKLQGIIIATRASVIAKCIPSISLRCLLLPSSVSFQFSGRNRDTSSTLIRTTHIELSNDKHRVIEIHWIVSSRINLLNPEGARLRKSRTAR